jgi:hypothetical protein
MRRPVLVKRILFVFSLDRVFLSAELLLSLPFHPHSSFALLMFHWAEQLRADPRRRLRVQPMFVKLPHPCTRTTV